MYAWVKKAKREHPRLLFRAIQRTRALVLSSGPLFALQWIDLPDAKRRRVYSQLLRDAYRKILSGRAKETECPICAEPSKQWNGYKQCEHCGPLPHNWRRRWPWKKGAVHGLWQGW